MNPIVRNEKRGKAHGWNRPHETKVVSESKSRNPKLLHGYKTQLLIYDKAEKTNNSIFFIVLLDKSHLKRIKTVYDYKKKNETADNKLPEIVVVDATLKKSASKS